MEIKKTIGIFDSGIGGLTVMKEIIKEMPNEDIVYFGDTARVPYGNKSPETIQKFSMQIANFLLEKNIKILVIACNTATSFSLKTLTENLSIPVIGVINPGSEAAYKISKNKKIGVIGTKGTIKSNAYEKALHNIDESLKVFSKACPLFVPLVEENWIDKKETYSIAQEYLKDLQSFNIDTLILGCTHYPIIKNVIQEVIGNKISIVDSAIETSKVVHNTLEKNNNIETKTKGSYKFFVSDDEQSFLNFGEKILDIKIENEHIEKITF